MQLSSRTTPRVDYRANLMLLSATGARMPIAAQTQNLSSGGLFVSSEETCTVGTLFDFELPLPDSSPRVRGRVVWVRNDTASGMGIEFVDLARSDEAMLRRTVKQLPPEPQEVRLYFENLEAPVRANGLISDDGVLSLTTRLPFLRLDSTVKICVRENEVRGKLRAASLRVDRKAKIPTLRVELALDRSREEALADVSGTIDTEDYAASQLPQPAPTIEPVPEVTRPPIEDIDEIEATSRSSRNSSSYWGWASVALLAAGLAAGAYWISSSSAPSKSAVSQPEVSKAAVVNEAAVDPATEPSLSSTKPTASEPPEPPTTTGSTTAPTTTTGEAAASTGTTTSSTGRTERPAPGAAEEAPPAGPMSVQLSPTKATVSIQLEGPTDGIESYPLASPAGIGVRLPAGTSVPLSAGRHVIHKGPLNNLLVRDTNRGRLVLLFFRNGLQRRHEVSFSSGRLSIAVFNDASKAQ